MTKAEIKEIINGKFAIESERQYWIDKLAEIERKEANAIENEKHLKALYKYAVN